MVGHPGPSHEEWSQLVNVWSQFKLALFAPASEDFHSFYWAVRLLRAAGRYVVYRGPMRRLFKLGRSCIPFFGMMLTLLCVAAYFATFRETVVRKRWCKSNSSAGCIWLKMHDAVVVFFAVNIIGNYLKCCFQSPGFVVLEDGESSESEVLNGNEASRKFGGCCFFTSRMNPSSEQRRSSKAFRECTIIEDELNNRSKESNDVIYHPSPEPTTCKKTGIKRPARAHYDRVSQRNVLEYDHFCPWVNNTIGKNNYRSFVLLLAYLVWGCFYGSVLLAAEFYQSMLEHVGLYGFNPFGARYSTGFLDLPPPWVLYAQYKSTGTIDGSEVLRAVFLLLLSLGIGLIFILLPHLKLIAAGLTPVEKLVLEDLLARHGRDERISIRNPFDMGVRRNFERVLGGSLLRLLLPFQKFESEAVPIRS